MRSRETGALMKLEAISEVGIQSQREAELRRELVRVGRWLSRLGFMPGTSGNLSVRLDRNTLVATPTGASKFLLRSQDMVTISLEGKQTSGARRVTSEIDMHLAIYRKRDDVEAVIHSHPPVATAFACTGRGLDEAFCQEAVMTLGAVPLACYATTGTHEVAASLAPHIERHSAILMANHGAVTYGASLLDAFQKMETVEHLAQVRLAAHQLGSVDNLKQEQVDQLRRARDKYTMNMLG